MAANKLPLGFTLCYHPKMRTDFYLLSTESVEARDLFACRLIEKAFFANHTLYVATDTEEQAAVFDNLLWSFRPDSFVPHVRANTPESAPVIIGNAQNSTSQAIWIHLSQQEPPADLACERLIEIIPAIADQQEAARQRFRQYRSRGYTLHTHNVN